MVISFDVQKLFNQMRSQLLKGTSLPSSQECLLVEGASPPTVSYLMELRKIKENGSPRKQRHGTDSTP